MTIGRQFGGEQGSATILMAAVMGVVVTFSAVAMVIAGYLAGHHRARAAADLAALSRSGGQHISGAGRPAT